jgi:iron uptake system component EfeO
MRILILTVLASLLLGACTPSPKPAPAAVSAPFTPEIEAYRSWVTAQADDLLGKAETFGAAVEAGDRAKAKTLYADSRVPYERIEPIAEALGDLDPRIDAREVDSKPEEWSGFHKIEKALWTNADLKPMAPVAKALVEDVKLLRARIEAAQITAPLLATGAVELLNEVSTSKITGEEEIFSHTDLWDFQANVDGAAKIWKLFADPVKKKDAALAATVDQSLVNLNALLARHKTPKGFVVYTDLKPAEVKQLSAAVDALAEPLSKLGALVQAE